MDDAALHRLLQGNPHLWRGRRPADCDAPVIPTGFPALDELLPSGGWPSRALIELIAPHAGIGEISLLLPAMRSLNASARRLVWIAPPYYPYAPALRQAGLDLRYMLFIDLSDADRDVLWCMEKLLRSGFCGMVLAWLRQFEFPQIRRLQLAAEEGETLGVVFGKQTLTATPAALRLQLTPLPAAIEIRILKARGSLRRDKVVLPL